MAETIVNVPLGGRAYDIVIGDVLGGAGERIAALLPGARVGVVTDGTVAGFHLDRLKQSLDAAAIGHAEIVLPPGEATKSLDNLAQVCDGLLAARLERRDAVVALGGGVVGDLAGFAAAVTRRGMALVQVPTTLLAQVDSSVGGKTGVNSPRGKNLVGAFHQPILVLADTNVLDTLAPREFAAGYAEVVKYGLIDDAPFFEFLERNRAAVFAGGVERQKAIETSCAAKARIVVADEFETGDRALLNLGHTFAHALEAHCRYDSTRLVHGEAVAIGLVLAHRFSARLGLAPPADAARVESHLRAAGLPTTIGDIPGDAPSASRLLDLMMQDKKVSRGRLTFILTRGIGRACIARNVEPGDVTSFLEADVPH